jgi:hypothetical protein
MEIQYNSASESVDSANNAGNFQVASNTVPGVDENEELSSEPKSAEATQSKNLEGVSESKETGFIDINKIIIDKTYLGRVAQHADTITLYKEAIIAGSSFPAIKLERSTNKLVDGGHTYKALRLVDKMCKKGELKKEDYPNAFVGELVRVEYVDIPEEKLPSFFAMTCNITHGQRPCPKDIYAIATLQFEYNPSYGVKDLARDMQFSTTAATEYSKKAREARKAIVDKYIIEASKAGKTQKEIETHLKEKYPTWKGTSQASISITLKEDRAKNNEAETINKETDLGRNPVENAQVPTDEENQVGPASESTPSEDSVSENVNFTDCVKVLKEAEDKIIDRLEFLSPAEIDLILKEIEILANNVEDKARKLNLIK